MADVQITVRGSSESKHSPELATVHLAVGVEGATRDGVFSSVSQSAAAIVAQVTPMHDEHSGPVTRWTSDQIRTWSHRPWNESGRQLPQVHHAAVDFEVRFSDFVALSRWIASVVPLAGVTVSGIEWSLTDPQRDALTEQSRVAAVHDAQTKAASYAHSLGLGDVRPVAIADVGLLGDPGSVQPASYSGEAFRSASKAMSMSMDMEQALDFTPQEIVITSYVDARFLA